MFFWECGYYFFALFFPGITRTIVIPSGSPVLKHSLQLVGTSQGVTLTLNNTIVCVFLSNVYEISTYFIRINNAFVWFLLLVCGEPEKLNVWQSSWTKIKWSCFRFIMGVCAHQTFVFCKTWHLFQFQGCFYSRCYQMRHLR